MNRAQTWLLILNLAGGVWVIGSYIYGFKTHESASDHLWGGVPLSIRPWYVLSMFLAAIGYFCFLGYLLFGIDPMGVNLLGGHVAFLVIFSLILIPSALWMPLTFGYAAQPTPVAWWSVRAVLLLVGLGSTALVVALCAIRPAQATAGWILALIGSALFAFHTLILDAVLWPVLYRK